MKPLLDDNFVAYLAYAIQKERDDLSKQGFDPDREQSRWLQVLGVIQKGVFSELENDIQEDVLVSVERQRYPLMWCCVSLPPVPPFPT